MLVKLGCPRRQTSQNLATCKILHFDPAPPKGRFMSVKCEQHSDVITVQVCLLYHPQNVALNEAHNLPISVSKTYSNISKLRKFYR